MDTEPQIRFQELVKFYYHLAPGGYLGIHDLHEHMSQQDSEHGYGWPYGRLPREIIQWVQDDELRVFHFPTPRGITFFYKTNPTDFRWK